MRVKALRGVCVGPGQHLLPGDCVDLDAATVTFLKHIKAVEDVKCEPKPEPKVESPKPDDPKPEPAKPAKKEK